MTESYKLEIKTYKKLNKLKKEKEIILFHHLGLGDAIVCNGMVNYISQKFNKVHLVVHERYSGQMDFLYSNNTNVELIIVDSDDDKKLLEFSKKNNLKILKVGFEYRKNGPFNIMLYKQLGLNHKISFEYFNPPNDDQKSKKLEKHLRKYYSIKDEFILVHDQSDEIRYELNINSNINSIKIEKESDIYKNIFLYIPLIKKAKEIHCVDSSFIHLVEHVETNSTLYYHTNRNSNINLEKDWIKVEYKSRS